MAMSLHDEAKALYAYDYVSLKTEERNRRNIKKRHLGDLRGKHGLRKAPTQLVGPLMNLYLPETRAINRTTADGIITDQSHQIRQTFTKNQREAILDEWARPSSPDDNPKQQFDSRESQTDSRPRTAPGYHGLLHVPFQSGPVPRPYTSGSFKTPPRKPPQPSGFMWVRMKQKGPETQVSKITDEIREYWENEDRRDREKRRRVKKQQESFTGGLLSFAGSEMDSVSLIDTFTGDATDSNQYYSIDGKVGSLVARHLQSGSKLHIGQNGNLQSDTLRIRSCEDSSESSDLNDTSLKSSTLGVEKPVHLIPLDWSEQVLKQDVKVVGVSKTATPVPEEVPCERHPVVYSKLIPTNEKPKIHIKLDKYCIRHRSRPKQNVDGTESLSQRITTITVDDLSNEDADAMTMKDYETLLEQKLEKDVSHHDTIQRLSPKPSMVDMEKIASLASLDGKSDISHPTRQRLSPQSIRVTAEYSASQATVILSSRQRLSPQAPEVYVKKSTSIASLDQMSDISSLTIDEPPSLGCSERSYSKRDRILSSLPHHPSIPNQRSVPAMPARNTAAKPWTSNPAWRPRSEMVRRRESSAASRRVKSGISRRYVFDEPPTPRSVQSPRPKPGQAFRSGVSSINSGPLEGEQEYITISHQIPSRHHGASSEADISLGRSNSSLLKVDNQPDCSCTEEARRFLSAALSGHAMFIDIPHGTAQSGITPQVSFKTTSDTGDEDDDDSSQYSEKDDLSDLDDFLDSPADENPPDELGDSGKDNLSGLEDLSDPSVQENPQSNIIIQPLDGGIGSDQDNLFGDFLDPPLDGNPHSKDLTPPEYNDLEKDNLSDCKGTLDPVVDENPQSKDLTLPVGGNGSEKDNLSGCEDSFDPMADENLQAKDTTSLDGGDGSEKKSNLSQCEKFLDSSGDENSQPDDQNHMEEEVLSDCKDTRDTPVDENLQPVVISTQDDLEKDDISGCEGPPVGV